MLNLAMLKGVNYPLVPSNVSNKGGGDSVVEALDNLQQVNVERYQINEWLW